MKQKKYSLLLLLGMFLWPQVFWGQKVVKILGEGSLKAAERGASTLFESNVAKAISSQVSRNVPQAAALPAIKGIDPAWVRAWQAGKIPPVNVLYGERTAHLTSFPPPPQVEIMIGKEYFSPFTQGVSPLYEYGEQNALDTSWIATPAYEQMNDFIRRENLLYKTRIVRAQVKNKHFYASLRSQVVQGEIPFRHILPSQRLDRLYVLVQHGPQIEAQIVSLLRAARQKYPQRPIVLATEYVWDNAGRILPTDGADPSLLLRVADRKGQEGALRLARNQQELENIAEGDYDLFPFLRYAIDDKIPVVGLEPGHAFSFIVVKEMAQAYHVSPQVIASFVTPDTLEEYFRGLSASEVGMRLRNERWEENLVRIEEQFPGALIVVVGGAAHLSYAEKYSVPNITRRGGKSFSVMLIGQEGRDVVSPLFSGLDERLYEQFMRLSQSDPNSLYYILSLKEPRAESLHTEQDVQEARRTIGADTIVVFPPQATAE